MQPGSAAGGSAGVLNDWKNTLLPAWIWPKWRPTGTSRNWPKPDPEVLQLFLWDADIQVFLCVHSWTHTRRHSFTHSRGAASSSCKYDYRWNAIQMKTTLMEISNVQFIWVFFIFADLLVFTFVLVFLGILDWGHLHGSCQVRYIHQHASGE